jgi:hypothetical protein|nr:MAG TPA: hypothetical protein [Caudoviricetes sp.]
MKRTEKDEYTTKHSAVITTILTLIFSVILLTIMQVRYVFKDSEYTKAIQERDMFKKRWEVRDKAATYYYDEYRHLKEKYDLVIKLKEDK